jgi:hypothetical protein
MGIYRCKARVFDVAAGDSPANDSGPWKVSRKKLCHPDRSEAEWRDLLAVGLSISRPSAAKAAFPGT